MNYAKRSKYDIAHVSASVNAKLHRYQKKNLKWLRTLLLNDYDTGLYMQNREENTDNNVIIIKFRHFPNHKNYINLM